MLDFGRFNVIYGWNGVGKTTLSNLFHHLQTKQSIEEGEVLYLIGQWHVRHSDLASLELLPEVRVFNRDTADRTVFELPGKQLSPIYFLGEDSVEKQKQIEGLRTTLDKAQQDCKSWNQKRLSAERELENFCTDEARAIKNLLTVAGGGPYNNYDSRLFKQVVSRLSASNKPLNVLSEEQITQYMATKDAKSKEKIQLLNTNFPNFHTMTSEVNSLLRRSVVSKVIDELINNPSLAHWLNQGLAFHQGEHTSEFCHFCVQPLPLGRLERLEAHFNDELRMFQKDLRLQIEKIQNAKQQISSLQLPDKSVFLNTWSRDMKKRYQHWHNNI